MTSSIPWKLERRTDKPPKTTNEFLRFPEKDPKAAIRKMRGDHAEVKRWRKWASEQPEALGWRTSPGAVEIEIYALRTRNGVIDCAAPYLLGKAMIDGLVDAKFLPGDHSGVVRREHLCGPLVVGYYGIRLMIREIEGVTLDLDVPRPAGRTRPAVRTRTKTVHTPAGGITLSGNPLVDGNHAGG